MNSKEPVYGGSRVTAAKELSTYKLDLVTIQEARWEGDGTESMHAFCA
jgi:hypothetical protein